MINTEHWIEHQAEPGKLILAWQAADQLQDRFRWAVGELSASRAIDEMTLRYFREGSEFRRLNQGRTYDQLLSYGYQGYPAFGIKHELHTSGVGEALLRRLPPRNRPDFDLYLRQFRLAPTLELSDVGLLAHTEAKLPSDGFSIVDPLDSATRQYDLLLEVAGYRYYSKQVEQLMIPGEAVNVSAEPDNEHDPHAVRLSVKGCTIGYVNRLQADAFLTWLHEAKVTAVVERMNGRPNHPRAFVFVRIREAS